MSGRTILVKKRFGKETLDVREFIRPYSYMVADRADYLHGRSSSVDDFIDRAYRFVVKGIHTPTGNLLTRDWHAMHAYHDKSNSLPLVFEQANDFWAFPSETLTFKIGDCDDKCILLTSLLRRHIPDSQVFCTVGTYKRVGHMWVTVGSMVLETTVPEPVKQQEMAPYEPMFRFNDTRVSVLRELKDTPLV